MTDYVTLCELDGVTGNCCQGGAVSQSVSIVADIYDSHLLFVVSLLYVITLHYINNL